MPEQRVGLVEEIFKFVGHRVGDRTKITLDRFSDTHAARHRSRKGVRHAVKRATAITAFLALAVASNLFTKEFGLVPIGFGLIAGAGAWPMGPVLVARDLVQDFASRRVVVAVVAVAAGLSWVLATPALAVASTVAFTIAETAD